jgi:2-oxoglutarate ferredoxin oxidoreductase subunit beta
MVKLEDFNTEAKPTWCPGCGNFGIHTALKQALFELKLEPRDICIVSGIGCSGKMPHWVNTYGIHTLHGRPVPVATGVKLANNKLTVIAEGGDGDGYGIGMCHFIHAMRRNLDITYIVHNNMVYGLTTGQTAPTSKKGFKTKSTPFGAIELAVNPLSLALASGATFIARGFAGDLEHLKKLIINGIKHKGFALIDVLQPCVTFNKVQTFEWYRKRIYKLEEEKGYNAKDRKKAYEKAEEWDDIPIGLFYKIKKPTYEDQCPTIAKIPLAKQKIDDVDISKIMEEFV